VQVDVAGCPTEVRPTMKPPSAPVTIAICRSRGERRNGASLFSRPATKVLTAKPSPPAMSAIPRMTPAASSKPSP
jgi:hypothetical protein